MSKVVRIQEDALEIALRYGNTLSEGIRAMESLCKASMNPEMIRSVVREELEQQNLFIAGLEKKRQWADEVSKSR
jgi:hypothetical protein